MCGPRIMVTLALLLAFPCLALAEATPDMATLVKRGLASQEQFSAGSAAWTSEYSQGGSLRFIVEQVKQKENRYITVFVLAEDDQPIPLLEIMICNGVWHVMENGGIRGSYRPYEAPFSYPGTVFLLRACEPKFLTLEEDNVHLLKAEDGVCSFRVPLTPDQQVMITTQLSQIDFFAETSGQPLQPELERTRADLRALLEEGRVMNVATETGLLTCNQTPHFTISMMDFQWADEDRIGKITPPENLPDHTMPIGGDMNDWVMIGHSGSWNPNSQAHDTEGRLLNVKTMELRRIPLVAGMVSPGCFSKDRSEVFVLGLELGHEPALFSINLQTGENTRISPADSLGVYMDLRMSPDGTTIATVRIPLDKPFMLGWPVLLIDPKEGTARELGEPEDQAFLNWLPEGSGLILARRYHEDMNAPAQSTVGRLGLDGTWQPIFRGRYPLLLPGERILFQDEDDDLWYTCNLNGRDRLQFGDGMKKYNFPTVSPDGSKLMMLHFGGANGPRPEIISLDKSLRSEVLPVGLGLWTKPVWQ